MRLRNILAKFVAKSLHINGTWKVIKSFILVKKCSNVLVAHHHFSGGFSNWHWPDGALSHCNKDSERSASQAQCISFKNRFRQTDLNKHEKIHQEREKTFFCQFCKAGFFKKSYLKIHEQRYGLNLETGDLDWNKWSNLDTAKIATLLYWPFEFSVALSFADTLMFVTTLSHQHRCCHHKVNNMRCHHHHCNPVLDFITLLGLVSRTICI